MIKRLIALIAALAIALMTTAGGVAFAKHGTTHRIHAAHHARAVHHKAPRHHAAEAEEPGGEEPGDGPGGHEDEPGAEVDHQFEGEE